MQAQFEKELRETQGINKTKLLQEQNQMTASNEGLNKQLQNTQSASVKQKQTFEAQAKLADTKLTNCLTEISALNVFNTMTIIYNF